MPHSGGKVAGMKKLMTVVGILAVAILSGCASAPKERPVRVMKVMNADGTVGEAVVTEVVSEACELGKAYYNQPNTAQLFHAEGTNVSFSITGATSITMNTAVPPKQIIPREQAWYSGVTDTLKSIAPWVFMGWAVHENAFGSSSKTTTTTTTN